MLNIENESQKYNKSTGIFNPIMKKKLAADLTSLAHRILQMKNKEDVTELHTLSKEVYEKLTVLAFTEKHFGDAQPTAGSQEIEEILAQTVEDIEEETAATAVELEQTVEEAKSSADDTFSNPDLSDLFVPADEDQREEMDLPGIATIHKMVDEFPEEEIKLPEPPQHYEKNDLEDITADFTELPEFERKVNDQQEKQLSLNDRLKSGIKIGMNDRIGFIKHLFNGSDQDYNRVLSQLNTMDDKSAAHQFIEQMVKPDYNNWTGKETYEERFIEAISSRFE